jgi:prenylcysteine oxidase/farnesylcysteine lyase
METETISARNVVDLLLKEEFGTGICGPFADGSEDEKDFVLGWDC